MIEVGKWLFPNKGGGDLLDTGEEENA